MKTIFTKISVIAIAVFTLTSCNNDDDINTIVIEEPTCSDGIMNGDETGVDCGGSCMPCEMATNPGRRADLYVTNNTDGNITKYSVSGDSIVTYTTTSTAAEGIYYDADADLLVQASRSGLMLDAYAGTSTLGNATINASFSTFTDLNSPRELAVSGDYYVVADNGENKFFVYYKAGNSFALYYTVEIPFPVWGIAFKGNDLYAVVDTTSDLAVFSDFIVNAMDGMMNPSKRVTIEGIVRTHGLTYDGTNDVMIMTDIGAASNATDDGGFHVINDFSTKFDALSDGDVLPVGMQTRIAGASTLMGNPIDVAYDSETGAVYIAEVGNGKILGFTNYGDGGDISPSLEIDLATASSIYFSSDETDGNTGMASMNQMTRLYTTSTADGTITVYDETGAMVNMISSASSSSEGIYYNALNDALLLGSRSEGELQYYSDFSSLTSGASATAAFTADLATSSPREIAVYGNKVVVADNPANMFYVYSYNGSSFTLENTFDPGFPVWGVAFKGDDLLAVVDTTSDLAIFEDFFSNTMDGSITPTKRVTISGITRTHGITYSAADDVLVMTDIGLAAGGAIDGGINVIADFSTVIDATSDGGTISTADQNIIEGLSTLMNNPIDVAYDHKTKTVFVSDIATGAVLGFSNALTTSGNIAPSVNNTLASASSLYLYNN